MKNLKYILLSLITVTLLFAACTDLSKDSSGSQEKTEYTLVGSLSFAGVSKAAYGRTATSSLSDELNWTITAKKGEKSYLPKEISGTSFSFVFEETGEYTIEAKALKDGQAIAQGSTSCTVSKGGDNFAQIIATPHACTIPGSVNLVINLDSVAADNVASVYVEWCGLESTADEFNKSFDVVNGKVTISFDDISCGAHTVKLSFEDSIGNTLYSCPEIINVYSGFTTDTWYGTSPYLSNGSFTLGNTFMKTHAVGLIPDTQMALYNGGEETTYYLVDSASEVITNNTAKVETDFSASSFCFDSQGYFYTIAKEDESAIFIKSNKPGFGSETLNDTHYSGAMYLDVNFGTRMSIDRINDFIYLFDSSSAVITQITGDDGEYVYDASVGAYKWAKSYSFSGDTNKNTIQGADAFTVYNGIAYIANTSEDALIIADLKNSTDVSGSEAVSLGLDSLNSLNSSGNAEITDIIYQDGAVYMLLRDYYNTSEEETGYNSISFQDENIGEIYSRGAVIKVNLLDNNSVETIGWTSSPLDTSEGKIYGYNSQDEYGHLCLTNEAYVRENYLTLSLGDSAIFSSTKIPNLYVPESESAGLYGPQKFVAVKPKKLVISDDGIAFYTDSMGAYCYKNINRVVTIDLEKFAILENSPVAITFGSEESQSFMSSEYAGSKANLYAGYFDQGTNTYQFYGESTYSIYGGIPLEE